MKTRVVGASYLSTTGLLYSNSSIVLAVNAHIQKIMNTIVKVGHPSVVDDYLCMVLQGFWTSLYALPLFLVQSSAAANSVAKAYIYIHYTEYAFM